MSLYGALFSGVSGLAAQSSAMGAISDNISNVNTIGYKGSEVNFQTLVTKQVSSTNYSPGGVQSKPRHGIDVQGLLQATNSSTDVALSGQGFMVVNEAAHPAEGDMFAYTRAGSFKVDKDGYLQNVSGWYMQGWPLMSWDNSKQASTVTVGNNVFMKAYKDSSGLTSYINDNIVSSTHLQPLNMNEVGGTASQTRNLRMGANLPNGADVGKIYKQPVTIYDSLGGDATVQFSWTKTAQNEWDLEGYPPAGAKSLTLRDESGNAYQSMGRLDFISTPTAASQFTMDINGTTYTFSMNGASGSDDGTTYNTFYTNPSVNGMVGNLANDIQTAYDLQNNAMTINLAAPAAGDTITIGGSTFDFSTATTVADMVDVLMNDTNFTSQGLKAFANGPDGSGNYDLSIYSRDAMTISMAGTGQLDTTVTPTTWYYQGSAMNPTATNTVDITTTGITYAENLAGTNSLVFRQASATDAVVVDGLDTMLDSAGTSVTSQGMDPNSPDTFSLEPLAITGGSSANAIEFNGDGTPAVINVASIDIDWANGSLDMADDDAIGMFLGNLNIRDGMTQLDGDYQLAYWSQNGAKFGNFSGVSIGSDGIVTALFDNGVTRPVFQIPVATFVNPNGMESLTGNVFISTDNSGEPTLRTPGNAGAGSMNAASLEASTVDIGEEFTTMIVTQRAYSAAAKIITTADQMLDELVQIKR